MYQISRSQRTDKRDEANGCFSQIANAHNSQVTITGVYKAPADSEARGSCRSEDPPPPNGKNYKFCESFCSGFRWSEGRQYPGPLVWDMGVTTNDCRGTPPPPRYLRCHIDKSMLVFRAWLVFRNLTKFHLRNKINEINTAVCIVHMTFAVGECMFLSLVVTAGDMTDIR
jgi:hypothetical protein